MEHFLSTKKKELYRPKKLVLDKDAEEILLNKRYYIDPRVAGMTRFMEDFNNSIQPEK